MTRAVNALRARGPDLLTSRPARIAGTVGGVGLFALLIVQLRNQWQENPPPLDATSVPVFVAALVATTASIVLMLLPWSFSLRALGVGAPNGLLAASLVGQLGKYVPGGIWPLLGRVGLATRLGVPLRAGSAGLAIEISMIVATSMIIAPFALLAVPVPMLAASAIAIVVVAGGLVVARTDWARRLVRKILLRSVGGPGATVGLRPLRQAAALYLLGWVITCAAFWLTARALFGTPVEDLPLLSGAYAVAWVVGFLVVIAPGGLGIRELVLVALLRPSMGDGEALLLAATSRIVLTSADFILAVAGVPILRHRLRGAALRREPVA